MVVPYLAMHRNNQSKLKGMKQVLIERDLWIEDLGKKILVAEIILLLLMNLVALLEFYQTNLISRMLNLMSRKSFRIMDIKFYFILNTIQS